MGIRNSIPMNLRCAYMVLHRRAQSVFAEYGSTADQYVVLSILAEEDGIIQSEIAERACSDPNTIGAMLRLLERNKIIRRRPHPENWRARCVMLTAEGRRLHTQLFEAFGPLRRIIQEALEPHDTDALMASLKSLADALNADEDSASRKKESRQVG